MQEKSFQKAKIYLENFNAYQNQIGEEVLPNNLQELLGTPIMR